MAIQIQSPSGVIADVGGSTFNALKVQQMPVDYGARGAYRKCMVSGTMAAGLAAGSEVFQFRWSDPTYTCLVQKVLIDGFGGSSTAFTAGFANMKMFVARSYTASGSGGTAATFTGDNGKNRTVTPPSLVGDVRIASTGALTAGTRTLDTDPAGQILFSITNLLTSFQFLGQTMISGDDIGPNHPLVLAQNEGFVIQATVPATGTWQFGVTVAWTEVLNY